MVIIIIIDDTNEKTIEIISVPYLNNHSRSLPSDVIDPSVKSLPINTKNNKFTTKKSTNPNNSTVLVFMRQNDIMKTNIKKKYFINDFASSVVAIFIY